MKTEKEMEEKVVELADLTKTLFMDLRELQELWYF